MAKKEHNTILAGLFALATIGIGLGVVLWLGASEYFRAGGREVYFYSPDDAGSLGLMEGSVVRIGGVQVGQVTGMQWQADQGRTLYVARLDNDKVVLRKGCQAHVEVPVIGTPFVVITDRGPAEKPEVTREAPVKLGVGGFQGQLNAIAGQVGEELDPKRKGSLLFQVHAVLGKIDDAMTNVQAATLAIRNETDVDKTESLLVMVKRSMRDLNSITGQIAHELDPSAQASVLTKIHATLNHVRNIAMVLQAQLTPGMKGGLLTKIHAILDEINQMATTAGPYVERTLKAITNSAEQVEKYVREDVGDILATLRKNNTKLLEILVDVSRITADAKELMVVHKEDIDSMIDDMTIVAENLKATSKEIRRSPWKLLKQPSEKEVRSENIYDAARAFANGASQLDQSIARLKALIKSKPNGVPKTDPTFLKLEAQLKKSVARFNKVEQDLWKELSASQK